MARGDGNVGSLNEQTDRGTDDRKLHNLFLQAYKINAWAASYVNTSQTSFLAPITVPISSPSYKFACGVFTNVGKRHVPLLWSKKPTPPSPQTNKSNVLRSNQSHQLNSRYDPDDAATSAISSAILHSDKTSLAAPFANTGSQNANFAPSFAVGMSRSNAPQRTLVSSSAS
jgi:hypothetical protein